MGALNLDLFTPIIWNPEREGTHLDILQSETQKSYVVYGGEEAHNFKGVKHLPWTQIKKIH